MGLDPDFQSRIRDSQRKKRQARVQKRADRILGQKKRKDKESALKKNLRKPLGSGKTRRTKVADPFKNRLKDML